MEKMYKGLRELGDPFLFLWLGEALAMLGATLMEFALGVWVFQRSGSVVEFSFAVLAAVLPALLISPLAGSIADHFERRYIILISDMTIATATGVLAVLLWIDALNVGELYIFNSCISLVAAFRLPAYRAAVSQLLSKEHYVRANGLMEMSSGMMSMLGPLAAGVIMSLVGLSGVVMLNLMAFGVGSLSVLKAFSHLRGATVRDEAANQPLVVALASNFSNAMLFFKLEPLMINLLVYGIVQGALIAFASTMLVPLVLARQTTQELGLILTLGSLGGLAGAITLVAIGKSQRLMIIVLLGDAVLAMCILVAGMCTSVLAYCVVAFVALFAGGVAEGSAHALWMRKAPQRFQGNIFGVVGALTLAAGAVVMISGGLLVDVFLEPALADGGIWAQSIGEYLGTGKGRGLGLIFVTFGGVGVLASLIALAHTHLRHLDQLVPDGERLNEGC